MKRIPYFLSFFLLAPLACFSSNDGDGSSGGTFDITGLNLPDALEILQQNSSDGTSGKRGSSGVLEGFETDSDFALAETRTYVWDDSMETVEQIDSILQMVAQTKAAFFVNDGAYIAMVNEESSERDTDHGDSGESGSTVGSEQLLNRWTVKSTRASTTSNQIVRFWVPMEEEEGPGGPPLSGVIFGYAVVTESPSAGKPYGDFELHFSGQLDGNPLNSFQFFFGTLRTVASVGNHIGFEYYEKMVNPSTGDPEGEIKVTIHINAANDQVGAGRVSRTDDMGGTEEFAFAYDEDYFARSNPDGTEGVFDRNSFNKTVWRYNLYSAEDDNLDGLRDGDLIDLNGGLPFRVNDSNGDPTAHGYIGYYGLWAEDMALLSDGMTVQGDNKDREDYTLYMAPGRLKKVTKEQVPLADLDESSLEYWEYNPGTEMHDIFKIRYDHVNLDLNNVGEFWKVATGVQGEQGTEWTTLGSEEQMIYADHEYAHFWSQLRSTSLQFVGGSGVATNPAGDSVMIAHLEEMVSGDATFSSGGDVTLSGWTECIRTEISQTDYDNGDVHYDDEWDLTEPPIVYTFKADDLGLYIGAAQVGLADTVTESESTPYRWGIRSGPLLTDAMVSEIANSGIQNSWQIWDQVDEFYLYETGLNPWNKHAWLVKVSDGQALTFESPLRFQTTVQSGMDINGSEDWNGMTFTLQYEGPGQLHGFPWIEEADGGDWFPAFGLVTGSGLTDLMGLEYAAKPAEIEMQMEFSLTETVDTVGLRAALTSAEGLTHGTDDTDWDDTCVGELAPTVTDPPAVIAGVVQ